MTSLRVWCLAVAALALPVACSSTPSPSVYEELLGLIPDTPDTRTVVVINDYALLREMSGVSLPGPGATIDDLEQYIAGLCNPVEGMCRMAQGPFISMFHQYGTVLLEMFHDSLAFDVRNVDQSVEAGVPPGRLEMLRGRFDPQATDRALSACSVCPTPLLMEHGGMSFYSWSEDLAIDLKRILAPPAFDQFGRGGRIAVQEDYVFRTIETPGMEALIDASMGQGSSLADAEEFRLLARGMTGLDAYSVLFSDQAQGLEETLQAYSGSGYSEQMEQARRAALEQSPLLHPYQALATGQGRDRDGLYMALVLVHSDAKLAEDNVDLLRQRIQQTSSLYSGEPWGEMVDRMEIRYRGRVLQARLYGQIARYWADWFYMRDSLLVHE